MPLCILFGSGELFLRAVHFRYSDTPQAIFSYPEWVAGKKSYDFIEKNKVGIFIKNPQQFWVPKPSFEDQYTVEKPAGITRIVTLGCSCTQSCAGSAQSYAGFMQETLNTKDPGVYQVLNAGAGSYSSYQGLQRLKHTVAKYQPDYLTIFFGWNDHWVAREPDHLIKMKSDWQINLINIFERSRVYQLFHKFAAFLFLKRDKFQPDEKNPLFRVPKEEYEKNLNAMIDFAEDRAMRPIFITAPFDPVGYRAFSLFPFSKEKLVAVHKEYNQIVRKTSETRGIALIDLENILPARNAETGEAHFSDGIHFSPAGCRAVADIITRQFRELLILKEKTSLGHEAGG